MESQFEIDGNAVREVTERDDKGKAVRASQWTFNDPVQAQKHAAQFTGKVSAGDLAAVADAANETRKQLAS